MLAKLSLEGTEDLWIAATHLTYSSDFQPSIVRRQQVTKLVEGIKKKTSESDRILFGADLNTSADGDDIKLLREYMDCHTKDIGPTWPLGGTMADTDEPYITVDHIFSRNMTVKSIEKFDESNLSDHSVIVAEIEL